MDFDLEKGLRDLGHDPRLHDAALSIDDILTRVHRQRTLRAAGLGAVGVAATAAVALGGVTASQHARRTIAAPTSSVTSTAASTTSPQAPSPSPTPTVRATEPPAEPMPLKDTSTRFDGVVSVVSDTPNPEGPLIDGDYVGHLKTVDLAAGTVTVDIAIFYGGAAAEAYNDQLAEPDEEVLDDYIMVNNSNRLRDIPVAPTLTVHTWCTTDPPNGHLDQLTRDPAEWAAAPRDRGYHCSDEVPSQQGDDLYWFDVRGGQVVQVIGQYIP